jgi:methylenetetrahydrofolate dehydrogenase (NADP+) / methenyltetrahydrofolate cyclohydrolase
MAPNQAQIIDGKQLAAAITQSLTVRVAQLMPKPKLAVILVGDDIASHTYVALKEAAAQVAGIVFEKHLFPSGTDEVEVTDLIGHLNADPGVNGILVQLPLPGGWHENQVIGTIVPSKDVDGFHPDNVRALLAGQPGIVPGLAEGIVELAASTGTSFAGKRAVVLANSEVFSQPLRYLFEKAGATAQAVNPSVVGCREACTAADILVAAIGRPEFVKRGMVKAGSVVVDVGYNRIGEGTVGDVDFTSVSRVAGWITPVPGGVGPVTVAKLLQNVVRAYELQRQ